MKTKRVLIPLICCVCLFGSLLNGEDGDPVIKGQMASPIMNERGELQFFYREAAGRVSFATRDMVSGYREVQDLLQCDGICSPVVKKDRTNRIHMLWVVSGSEHSDVFSGTLEDSTLSEHDLLFRKKGYIDSPDFCFDRAGGLWALWVLHSESQNVLIVKNKGNDRYWVMNPNDYSEVMSPEILVDAWNRIWVFWTQVQTGREEIFCRSFDGFFWSEPSRVNRSNEYPHILVDAAAGPDGLPWLVWSAYDGRDYEVFSSHWTSMGWSEEESLTDNLCTDAYPHISMVWDHIFVIWSRSSGEENGIFCTYRDQNKWTEEIGLVTGKDRFIHSPQVVTEQGRIGLVWESDETLYSQILYFDDLREKGKEVQERTERRITFDPARQDNTYIGFGDSITYGYIDSSPAPDKGYVPRLESLLESAYGDSEVVNEGKPGEKTLGGLDRISDALSGSKGRYLLLMEGTNDVVTNSITMNTSAFNLEEMTKTCLELGVMPLLSTILPRNDLWWYFPFYKQRVYTLNDSIREIPGRLHIPFIDMFDEFWYYEDGEETWRNLLSSDRLHPNEKGYQFMAEMWFDEIEVFPFPPTITEGKRTYDEILFDSEPVNLIVWRENAKLSQEHVFKGYKVYRKTYSEPVSAFHEVAFLPINMVIDHLRYFDKNIDPGESYHYVVSLVRNDEVEGPCSNMVGVGSVK